METTLRWNDSTTSLFAKTLWKISVSMPIRAPLYLSYFFCPISFRDAYLGSQEISKIAWDGVLGLRVFHCLSNDFLVSIDGVPSLR